MADSIIEQARTYFDTLVKSRFIELFGDLKTNNKQFLTKKGKDLFKFSSGKFLEEEYRKDEGVPAYGGNGIAWYTDQQPNAEDTLVIGRVGVYCGNVRYISEPIWVTDNAIYIKEFKTTGFNKIFLEKMMNVINFHQYSNESAQPKITQKPLEETEYVIPPIELQNSFVEFVKQVDKSRSLIFERIKNLKIQ